jgi:hypothetical protein
MLLDPVLWLPFAISEPKDTMQILLLPIFEILRNLRVFISMDRTFAIDTLLLIPTRWLLTYWYNLCERLVGYYHCRPTARRTNWIPSAIAFVDAMNSHNLTTTSVEQQYQQYWQAKERIKELLVSLVTMAQVALSWLYHLGRLRRGLVAGEGPSSSGINVCIAILQDMLRQGGFVVPVPPMHLYQCSPPLADFPGLVLSSSICTNVSGQKFVSLSL